MPKVSIIMNCLNGERYLRESIASVYAQTHQNWEIIFIDNASHDGSAEIAKSHDSRLKYFYNPQTVPLYAARNIGIQHAGGEFIAFLDVDDIWAANKLECQLEIMKQYSSVYLVATGILRKNEVSGKITRALSKSSTFITFLNALTRYPVVMSSVLLRYDELSKPKIKFEPTLNLTGDYELFIKLIYQYQAFYVGEPLVTYRVHGKNLTAKLVQDWPKEIERTHARLMAEFSFSDHEKMLLEKRYLKTFGLVCLAGNQLKKTRSLVKKYFFKDVKFLIIYLSTFSSALSKWVLKMRGFNL